LGRSTQSGSTAQRVSKYRPSAEKLALTPSDVICRRLVLYWGVYASRVEQPASVDDLKKLAQE
jgi:pyruvate kinase